MQSLYRKREVKKDIKEVVIPGIVYIMVPWEYHPAFFLLYSLSFQDSILVRILIPGGLTIT